MKQFIRIYSDWFAQTAQLTDADKGKLIDALLRSVIFDREELPEGNARFVYPQIMERIRREIDTHNRRKMERELLRNLKEEGGTDQ